jgi:hypothetical protein
VRGLSPALFLADGGGGKNGRTIKLAAKGKAVRERIG